MTEKTITQDNNMLEHFPDGVALDEILRGPVRLAERSAQSDEWNGRSGGDHGGLSEEEKEALADRFRSLGYVG